MFGMLKNKIIFQTLAGLIREMIMKKRHPTKEILISFCRLLTALASLVKAYIYLFVTLKWSFSFHSAPNLTASPKEHLQRARKLLREPNSHLFYAAIEIRFALERITRDQIIWADKLSNKDLKEYNSYRNIKTLRRLYEDSKYPYDIYFKLPHSEQMIKLGQYKPLDESKVKFIYNKLGELLHAQFGLKFGIADDPWYIETRKFLKESIDYLECNIRDNSNFFHHYEDEKSVMVKNNNENF